MLLLRGKSQVLISQTKSNRMSLHRTTYFALQILLFYQFIQFINLISCSSARHHHHNHHNHHHHHHHSRSRENLDTSEIADDNERQDDQYGRQQGQKRLHDRAVYMAYDHSRINSSESLSSSWFYQQDQPAILEQCCACDEAKYELVFEGLWSKYTHPDDFPENYWLAYFSDIIGASHSNDFRMWAQDSLASDGVKELAETGATKKLESELKQMSSKTRTIIKARELRYPTLNTKTSAVFRTDKHHHLVSILSKLGPSPDWMVGVSSLELCQVDCTWAAQRVVNLYLWDAGTDSGTTFMSSDFPTRPQERIHPYRRGGSQVGASPTAFLDSQADVANGGSGMQQYERNQRPDQSGSDLIMLPPVIEETSTNYQQSNGNNYQTTSMTTSSQQQQQQQQEQMKPFARLTVTRQRIYEKSCNGGSTGEPSMTTYNRPSSYNTMTHHQNQNQQQPQQQQQQPHLNHLQPAINPDTLIEPTRQSYSDCRFTDWSDWSSCSSTCGKGIRTRTRSFYDDQAHLAPGCSQSDLIEKENCLADCVGNASCVTHDWSEWSKCSVSCGQGYRKRTRSPIGPIKAACGSIELAEMEQCTGSCGQADSADDQSAPSSCAVTEWSQWSECSVACGKGTKIRTRQLLRKEDLENCGNLKLLQKQSCNGRPELCKQVAAKSYQTQTGQPAHRHIQQHVNQKQINFDLPVIDCKLSNWSPWSTCSALCGSGKRTRSRYIIQMPQNGGKPCDKKLSRTQKCKDLPLCPQDYPGSSGNDDGGSLNVNRNNKVGSHYRSATTATPPFSNLRTAMSTTTPASSMMDDEDDSKFSRLLKAELGHLQLNSWTPTESYISDEVATPTEMELIGSSSFRIRNGFVYPFAGGPKERHASDETFK